MTATLIQTTAESAGESELSPPEFVVMNTGRHGSPQRMTIALLWAAMLAGVLYSAFAFNPSNAGQAVAYITFVIAQLIVIAKVAVEAVTIIASDRKQQSVDIAGAAARLASGEWAPTVDIMVTVYNEPLDIVEKTVRAALAIRYPHRTAICDDGRSSEMKALAKRLGADYVTRPDNAGAKAGNINNALASWSTAEYVALLDADHVPVPEFLDVLLLNMVDERCAFVQSPQSYSNRRRSRTAQASHESQLMFYDVIAGAKNSFNAAFSVGTNVLYRRAAIDSIGGMYAESNSEDIWTSMKLHQAGWKSMFITQVLAEGLAPETMTQYLTQQDRWAHGGFEVLFHGKPWKAKGLTGDQRIQYLQPALHYLHSLAMLYFMLLPASFLVYFVQPLSVTPFGWLARYLPFWLLIHAASWVQVGRPDWWSYFMSIAAAPVHVRALISTIRKKDYHWSATHSVGGSFGGVFSLMPFHILMAFLLTAAVIVGVFPLESSPPVIIALALCASFAFAFYVVVGTAMVQMRRSARAARTARPV